ncbi:hypothetical protein F5878DRAFT_634310 [Lentinula raphanica]|uniref:Secreted protein n=1 Tax=Lentinula raphanica TaxID=153919 RepID=A0AA38NY34_9AGAR|nr:hypothetical protein F5878DRAFT_634310 [Lentinula raphanica]
MYVLLLLLLVLLLLSLSSKTSKLQLDVPTFFKRSNVQRSTPLATPFEPVPPNQFFSSYSKLVRLPYILVYLEL